MSGERQKADPVADPRTVRAQSNASHTGDYLLFGTSPCSVALAASSVSRIVAASDQSVPEALLALERLTGVSSVQALDAARRVLIFDRQPVGITIPDGVHVLAASFAQLLPLPELFDDPVFSAMLLWHGQPKALLIDESHLLGRARAALDVEQTDPHYSAS